MIEPGHASVSVSVSVPGPPPFKIPLNSPKNTRLNHEVHCQMQSNMEYANAAAAAAGKFGKCG